VSPVVPHFELSEESSDGGACVISVRGEIHVTTAPQFAERLTAVIEGGRTAIVLDMSGVEFIDSTGLSVLLNCTNPTVLRLFQITNLDSTFDIFSDRAAAVAHVTASDAV
jgi:anti-sigma B factor antagonist